MNKIIFVVGIILTSGPSMASELFWLVGPMFHANFGNSKIQYSLAVEGSTWGPNFWGVDYGIEYEIGNTCRIYSEIETGYNYTGAGIGPVMQFSKNGIGVGMQGSGWVNYLIGADIRYKVGFQMDQTFSPGLYLKIPYSYPRLSFESPEQ